MTKTPHSDPTGCSPEWSRELREAITEAASEAVSEHLAAGNPVHCTDDDGDICELRPGYPPRKLSQAEIDRLTRKVQVTGNLHGEIVDAIERGDAKLDHLSGHGRRA